MKASFFGGIGTFDCLKLSDGFATSAGKGVPQFYKNDKKG